MSASVQLRDYEVRFRREEYIASIALDWRVEAGHRNSPDFNIVRFICDVLKKRWTKKGTLQIRFFDSNSDEDLAYVTFQPLTLHVDREIWRVAELGDPLARFILAHEVGHIILHDHHAKAFSPFEPGKKRRTINEISAEWQANTFAEYLLLPDHIVGAFYDSTELAKWCSVERKLAEERMQALQRARRPRVQIDGDFCIQCGEFTTRVAGNVKCPKCEQ
jgi:hypothetical protein